MNSDDDEIDYETVVDYRMKASDDKAMASHVLRAKSQAAKKMPMLKSLSVGFALWLRVFLVSLNIIEFVQESKFFELTPSSYHV